MRLRLDTSKLCRLQGWKSFIHSKDIQRLQKYQRFGLNLILTMRDRSNLILNCFHRFSVILSQTNYAFEIKSVYYVYHICCVWKKKKKNIYIKGKNNKKKKRKKCEIKGNNMNILLRLINIRLFHPWHSVYFNYSKK